jgi:hypothetical protein
MRWVGVIACVLAQTVAAENEPPINTQYLRPHDPSGKASVAVECGRMAAEELACRFTHITIEYLANPDAIDAEIARALAELRQKVKSAGLKKYVESLCGDAEDIDHRRRALAHDRAVGRHKSARWLAALATACDDPTQARLEEFIRQHVIANSKSCMVNVYQRGPVKFTRIAPGKWGGSDGPYGECKESYAYTLEYENESPSWSVSWSRTLTSVDASSDSCKAMRTGTREEFSFRGYSPEVSCEEIEFFRW